MLLNDDNFAKVHSTIFNCAKTDDIAPFIKKNSLFLDNERFVYISNDEQLTLANKLSTDLDGIDGYNEYYGKFTNIYICNDLSTWIDADTSVSTANSNVFTIKYKHNTAKIRLELIYDYDESINNANIQSMSFQAYDYFITHGIPFPESISKIDRYAFSHSDIDQFSVPLNVRQIRRYAFNSSSLHQIEFNPNLQRIDEYAFNACDNLAELDFSKTKITSFLDVCTNCIALTSISFPETLAEISFSQIKTCPALHQMHFNSPTSTILKEIENNALFLEKAGIHVIY